MKCILMRCCTWFDNSPFTGIAVNRLAIKQHGHAVRPPVEGVSVPGAAQILAIRRKARNLPQAPILLIMHVEMRTYLSTFPCAPVENSAISISGGQVESTGVGSSQMRASITP